MRIQLSLSLLLTASAALATDGYFDHGYGVKAKGLGGAGVAFAQDSLVVATNPAGLVDVDDSHQVGLTWFAPDRSVTVNGNTFDGNEDGSTPVNSTFNFNVTPVNDAPVITGDLAATVDEGGTYTITAAGRDALKEA